MQKLTLEFWSSLRQEYPEVMEAFDSWWVDYRYNLPQWIIVNVDQLETLPDAMQYGIFDQFSNEMKFPTIDPMHDTFINYMAQDVREVIKEHKK